MNGMVGNARPHVRVEAQSLAGGHIEAFEAAALRCGDGGLQKHFRAAQGFPSAGLNTRGIAAQVDFFTDFDGLDFDGCAGRFQDFQGGGHDLGADAVAMRDGDGGFRHRKNKHSGLRRFSQPGARVQGVYVLSLAWRVRPKLTRYARSMVSARALRVPMNRISAIVNGKGAITVDTAMRLARYFGTSPQYWLNLQVAYDLEAAAQEIQPQIAKEVLPRTAA